MKEETSGDQDLKGRVFVVTGSLNYFANRNELKEQIEKRGGKDDPEVSPARQIT